MLYFNHCYLSLVLFFETINKYLFIKLEPFIILFHPCVSCSLARNGVVYLQYPFRHDFLGWLLSRTIYHPFSIKHSILPFLPHCGLDRLVDANIHRLAEVSTSRRDVNHLNPERLDSIDDVSHHVHAICIKDECRHNTRCLRVFPRDQDKIDPRHHGGLVHPGFWLTQVMAVHGVRREFSFCDSTVRCTLKNQHGWQHIPTSIKCDGKSDSLVSVVEAHTWTVLVPLFSSVLFEWKENGIGV